MKKRLMTMLACCLLLSGCQSSDAGKTEGNDPEARITRSNMSYDAGFDTIFTLREMTVNQADFDQHFNDAVNLFTHYNDLFDIYNDYDGITGLKAINDNAGIQPVAVDHSIIEMLKEAKEFYDLSDGEFDITMGALLNVWHQYRENGIDLNEEGKEAPIPTEEELKEAAVHRGWDKIEIDEEKGTVYITDPEVSLDVGGIAKGFATEKIADALEKETDNAVAINAGGNNRTIGVKPDGTPWNVGIQNPGGQGSLFVVSIDHESSFVTSGDYERYYTGEDGRRYHHIIDPSTLYPADHFHSVTIITKDSGQADCMSTTLFTLDFEEGNAFLKKYKEAHPDTDVQAIWIMDQDKAVDSEYGHSIGDYYVAYTAGLEGKITWQ